MPKMIIVERCEECPYIKRGKPMFCYYSNIDILNTNIIDKGCRLEEYRFVDDYFDKKPVESGKTLKEVISGNGSVNGKSDTKQTKSDSDDWWDDDEEAVIKTDTDKICILCGSPFNGDEITEMDVDDGIVKVHKVCSENIDALVDDSDEIEIVKENIDKLDESDKDDESDESDDWSEESEEAEEDSKQYKAEEEDKDTGENNDEWDDDW